MANFKFRKQNNLIITIFLMTVCTTIMAQTKKIDVTSVPTNVQGNTVPYILAHNYFVKNTVKDDTNPILAHISNQKTFDSLFGMATLMGKDGRPTPINFKKQFVLALINSSSNKDSLIIPLKLLSENAVLTFCYQIKQFSQPSSYTLRLATILIVDKKYETTINSLAFDTLEGKLTPLTGGDLDEYGCKHSTGATYSFLKNACITPWTQIHLTDKNNNVAALLFDNDKSRAELLNVQYHNTDTSIILKKKGAKWVYKNLILSQNHNHQYILRDGKAIIYTQEK